MNCDPGCPLKEFDEGWWCRRFNRQLDDPPQMVSECEDEAEENERINYNDEVREDRRLFRSIDDG